MVYNPLAILRTLIGIVLGCFAVASMSYGNTLLAIQTVDAAQLDNHLALNEHLVFLPENEHDQQVTSFIALADQPVWQSQGQAIPNLGLGVTPHWFALRLTNSGSVERSGLLDMSYTMMDYLDVYYISRGEITVAAEVGDARPFSVRVLAHRGFLAPIVIKPGDDVLVLIRAESSGAMRLPLSLWSLEGFFEHEQMSIAPQLAFV